MTQWMLWLIVAGLVVILELFSGTFYLLMVAIGLVAGASVAFFGGSDSLQLIVAAAVGVFATYALRRSKFGKMNRADVARDPNINLDIGQHIAIEKWSEHQEGAQPTARVLYRDALWDVELAPDMTGEPGNFIIQEIRGSRLIVTKSTSNH